MTIVDHRITEITLLNIGDSEYEKKGAGIIGRVIESQSTDVDTISGATLSSRTILMAIDNALTEGKVH